MVTTKPYTRNLFENKPYLHMVLFPWQFKPQQKGVSPFNVNKKRLQPNNCLKHVIGFIAKILL